MTIEPFIRCSDISASLKFYTEILDFRVLQTPDPDPEAFLSMYAFLQRENSRVHLSQHEGDGVYGNVLYIRTDDLEGVLDSFIERGLNTENEKTNPVLIMKPICQSWGMKEFSVADPDGNRLTFGQEVKA